MTRNTVDSSQQGQNGVRECVTRSKAIALMPREPFTAPVIPVEPRPCRHNSPLDEKLDSQCELKCEIWNLNEEESNEICMWIPSMEPPRSRAGRGTTRAKARGVYRFSEVTEDIYWSSQAGQQPEMLPMLTDRRWKRLESEISPHLLAMATIAGYGRALTKLVRAGRAPPNRYGQRQGGRRTACLRTTTTGEAVPTGKRRGRRLMSFWSKENVISCAASKISDYNRRFLCWV